MKNLVHLLLAAILIAVLQPATAQPTPSQSLTNTQSWSGSWSGSWSSSWTNSNSYSISTSWTNSNSYSTSTSWTNSGSYSGSTSWTNSNSYSLTTSASYTISQTLTAAFGYPQIIGIVNTINDLYSVNVAWQHPVGFNFQSYQLILIVNGTSITISDIPTESILLTAANTGGLIQPDSSYFVQVRGFLNGAFGPQSLPVTVSTSGGDVYGPVGIDSTSINNLKCNYYPQNLLCRWATGARPWLNATFYVWCNRTVDPIKGAMAWIVQKFQNPTGTLALPQLAIIPLPSGSRCAVHLTAFYSTVTLVVDLDLGSAASGFVNTDKPTIKPNTPLVVPT